MASTPRRTKKSPKITTEDIKQITEEKAKDEPAKSSGLSTLLDLEIKKEKERNHYIKREVIKKEHEQLEKKSKDLILSHFSEVLDAVDISKLSQDQVVSAKLLAKGTAMPEICSQLDISMDILQDWISKPSYQILLSQLVQNSGLSLKTMREIETRNLLNKINDEIENKIDSGVLSKQQFAVLFEQRERLIDRIDKYRGDDIKTEKSDISVVIQNVVQKNTGQDRDIIDYFGSFPTKQKDIDVDFE